MISYYRYCGLLLASDFTLPELTVVSEAPESSDLTLRFASVPTSLRNATHRTPTYEYNGQEALWRLDGVARYFVGNGGTLIEIDPAPGSNMASVRLFLLQSVFSLASVLRGEWLLTASAVERGGRVCAFMGPSASGKSTAAAVLIQRGYRLVSDSLLRISRDSSGQMIAYPQAPWIWLWPDVMKKLGLDAAKAELVRPEIELRRMIFPIIERPMPLTSVTIFRQQMVLDQNTLHYAEKSGGRRFELLMHLGAGTTWLEAMANRQQLFHWCLQVGKTATIGRLDIPWGLKQIDRFGDQLNDWCNKACTPTC
jgi:hypothetical protein